MTKDPKGEVRTMRHEPPDIIEVSWSWFGRTSCCIHVTSVYESAALNWKETSYNNTEQIVPLSRIKKWYLAGKSVVLQQPTTTSFKTKYSTTDMLFSWWISLKTLRSDLHFSYICASPDITKRISFFWSFLNQSGFHPINYHEILI